LYWAANPGATPTATFTATSTSTPTPSPTSTITNTPEPTSIVPPIATATIEPTSTPESPPVVPTVLPTAPGVIKITKLSIAPNAIKRDKKFTLTVTAGDAPSRVQVLLGSRVCGSVTMQKSTLKGQMSRFVPKTIGTFRMIGLDDSNASLAKATASIPNEKVRFSTSYSSRACSDIMRSLK